MASRHDPRTGYLLCVATIKSGTFGAPSGSEGVPIEPPERLSGAVSRRGTEDGEDTDAVENTGLKAGIRKMKVVTQVLDSTYGRPAAGVRTRLARVSGDDWTTVARAETNSDGLIEDWDNWRLERGLYRITFDCDSYFAGLGGAAAYPEVTLTFRLMDESLVQMQLALAPHSYSTYFGTLDRRTGTQEGQGTPK